MSTTAAPTVDVRIAWFARECQRNGVRIERHIHAAERGGDREMAAFFRRAQRESDKSIRGARR